MARAKNAAKGRARQAQGDRIYQRALQIQAEYDTSQPPNRQEPIMASTTRKPRQSTAAKAALDANAAAVVAEKLTQPDNGLTTSDEQSATDAAPLSRHLLQAEKAAVAERAAAVAAEQAAATPTKATPKPTKPIDEAKLAETNAITTKVLELLASVDLSSAENSATKIAVAAGTTYSTVRRIARENNHLFAAQRRRSAS